MKKKALIFDYDGVIADSLKIVRKIISECCAKYNFEVNEHNFPFLFDGNFYEQIIKHGFPKEKMADLLADLQNDSITKQQQIGLFPGAKEMLKKMAENHTLFIVSSSSSTIIETDMEEHGLDYGMFEAILGVDESPSKVEKITYVMERYHDHDCYFVTDTVGDIIEGKVAGAKTIAVTWGYHKKERLEKANPNKIADQMSDLLSLVNQD